MRVIAGKARRLQLKTIDGMGTRPTTDRIKETLFNMINNDMPQTVFLDLFSGSGAIGIEALSRGASKAYFVESNKKAVQCIKDNLNFTKLQDDAVVMAMPDKHYEKDVLIFLSKSDLINKSSRIIVEASLDTDFSYASELGYEIIKEKEYKTNKHVFLKLIGE